MQTSIHGICSILSHEEIVLTSYEDIGGTLTIGAGHTEMAGAPAPVPGMQISLLEAVNIFREDLRRMEDAVNDMIDVPLTQHQFDALVSWNYNTGAVRNSTLTRELNAGNYGAAAKQFAVWKKVKGQTSKGLVNRRKRETALFVSADYGSEPILVRDVHGGPIRKITIDDVVALTGGKAVGEEEQTTDQLLANPKSRLLPRQRPAQKEATTRAAWNKFAHLTPESRRADAVKLLAVRGYYTDTMGKVGQNDRAIYDDAIFVMTPDHVYNFNGNTDPSRFKAGIAMLKSGQSVCYKPGPHGFKRKNGPYPAFRQNSACTVSRDGGQEETGIFWINLHRGGNTTTSSAGCQTLPPNQWGEFRTLLNRLLRTYEQNSFYYTLIDVDQVPQEVQSPEPSATVAPPSAEPQAQPQHPVPAIRGVSNMANDKKAQLLDVAATALALAEQMKELRGEVKERRAARADDPTELDDVLKLLVAAMAGKGTVDPAPVNDTELTPVNGAFGATVGKALDGRKTGIGILGLLATTVVPIFFPALSPVLDVVANVTVPPTNPISDASTANLPTVSQVGSAVREVMTIPQKIVQAAVPVFTGLSAWGVLGKVDKWVRRF